VTIVTQGDVFDLNTQIWFGRTLLLRTRLSDLPQARVFYSELIIWKILTALFFPC